MESKTENELITEGSALIADFMGWEKTKSGNHMIPNLYPFTGYSTGETETESDKMNFHDRWDWLMPVIEKISQYVYDEQEEDNGIEKRMIKHRAYPTTFGMISHEGKFMFRFNRQQLFESDFLIDAAFAACVDFIAFMSDGGN